MAPLRLLPLSLRSPTTLMISVQRCGLRQKANITSIQLLLLCLHIHGPKRCCQSSCRLRPAAYLSNTAQHHGAEVRGCSVACPRGLCTEISPPPSVSACSSNSTSDAGTRWYPDPSRCDRFRANDRAAFLACVAYPLATPSTPLWSGATLPTLPSPTPLCSWGTLPGYC